MNDKLICSIIKKRCEYISKWNYVPEKIYLTTFQVKKLRKSIKNISCKLIEEKPFGFGDYIFGMKITKLTPEINYLAPHLLKLDSTGEA